MKRVTVMLPLALTLPFAALAQETGDLPDPTRPASYVFEQPATLSAEPVRYQLSAVRIGAAGRFAIINGTLVRIGDSIGAAVVRAIDADSVTLETNFTELRLPLSAVRVKIPAGVQDSAGRTR